MKRRKAPGPDNLIAEHLIEGGQSVVIRLTSILNAIIAIPDSFKSVLVVPVYKSSGKDPLSITISPVLLEFQSTTMEANVPHLNQSGYRKKVSCADAVFAYQQFIVRYLNGGSRVYM